MREGLSPHAACIRFLQAAPHSDDEVQAWIARRGTGFHQREPVDRELSQEEADAASELLTHIEHGEATRVASLFYLTPPVTAVIAYFLFGESLSATALVGMAVGVTGVALATRRSDVTPEP